MLLKLLSCDIQREVDPSALNSASRLLRQRLKTSLEHVKTFGTSLALCPVRTPVRANQAPGSQGPPQYAPLPRVTGHRVAALRGKFFSRCRSTRRCSLARVTTQMSACADPARRHHCVIKGWLSWECDGLSEHQR